MSKEIIFRKGNGNLLIKWILIGSWYLALLFLIFSVPAFFLDSGEPLENVMLTSLYIIVLYVLKYYILHYYGNEKIILNDTELKHVLSVHIFSHKKRIYKEAIDKAELLDISDKLFTEGNFSNYRIFISYSGLKHFTIGKYLYEEDVKEIIKELNDWRSN